MADVHDWRLRVDLDDPAAFHARLRGARHFERELEPLVSHDVVLSYDDDTLFAYADTEAEIREARRGVEHQLDRDGIHATLLISRWDDSLGEDGEWQAVDPPPDHAGELLAVAEHEEHAVHAARAARTETRTVAITSGRMVREWFETSVGEEARELGVELSIVEHPHLLTTQIAFTLTGETEKVDAVVADLRERAGRVTRLATFYTTVGE